MASKPNKTPIESTRVVIIGSGLVGATSAYALMLQGSASEIVLVDIDKKRCAGEVLDLQHGSSFLPEVKIWAGDFSDCKEADVVVITAGLKQKENQSRLELAKTNAKIVSAITKNITKYTKKAVILVVTNPLDIMTYTAWRASKLPKNQVFGTGTVLDSSRFRHLLAEKIKIDPESMGAFLLGEHGDSSVPVFSHANVMGEPISSLKKYGKINTEDAYKKVRNAAYELISKKGATYYAIGLVVARLVRAILYDENHVFPVSVYADGHYDLKDVYLSLPAVVGRNGIKQIIEIKLSDQEKNLLQKSAAIIKQALKELE